MLLVQTKMPADPATKLLARVKLRDLERIRDVANAKALEACQENETDEVLDVYNKRFAELDKMARALESGIVRADDNLQDIISACKRVVENMASHVQQTDDARETGSCSPR